MQKTIALILFALCPSLLAQAPSFSTVTASSTQTTNNTMTCNAGRDQNNHLIDGYVYCITVAGAAGTYVNTVERTPMANPGVWTNITGTGLGTAYEAAHISAHIAVNVSPTGVVFVALYDGTSGQVASHLFTWNGSTSAPVWTEVTGGPPNSASNNYIVATPDSLGYLYTSAAWAPGAVYKSTTPGGNTFSVIIPSLYPLTSSNGGVVGGIYVLKMWNLEDGRGDTLWVGGEGGLENITNITSATMTTTSGSTAFTLAAANPLIQVNSLVQVAGATSGGGGGLNTGTVVASISGTSGTLNQNATTSATQTVYAAMNTPYLPKAQMNATNASTAVTFPTFTSGIPSIATGTALSITCTGCPASTTNTLAAGGLSGTLSNAFTGTTGIVYDAVINGYGGFAGNLTALVKSPTTILALRDTYGGTPEINRINIATKALTKGATGFPVTLNMGVFETLKWVSGRTFYLFDASTGSTRYLYLSNDDGNSWASIAGFTGYPTTACPVNSVGASFTDGTYIWFMCGAIINRYGPMNVSGSFF